MTEGGVANKDNNSIRHCRHRPPARREAGHAHARLPGVEREGRSGRERRNPRRRAFAVLTANGSCLTCSKLDFGLNLRRQSQRWLQNGISRLPACIKTVKDTQIRTMYATYNGSRMVETDGLPVKVLRGATGCRSSFLALGFVDRPAGSACVDHCRNSNKHRFPV